MGDDMQSRAGAVVLVTGAVRGIGLACARRFAAAGDRVVVADLDPACHAVAAGLGPPHMGVEIDVSDPVSVTQALSVIETRFGPVDILINNAGIVDAQARPFLDVPTDVIDRLLAVNLDGPFLLARAVVPGMAQRGGGAIVNIGSGAGVRALPGRTAYGVTKGALLGLTRALAVELAPAGIRVNAVLPGYTDTDIIVALEAEGRFQREHVAGAIPLGRLGRPEEVAEAVFRVAVNDAFLANVQTMAARLRQAIEQMMPNHDGVFDSTRGLGLMIGIKLKDAVEARAFVAHLRDNHGLLTVAAGENVVRILPPLVIDDSHVAECVEKLSAGARTFEAAQ